MNRQILCGTQQWHERVSTSLLLAATLPGSQRALGSVAGEAKEVSQVMRFTASLLLERLYALAPAECLPMHLNLRLKKNMSDWLLLTGY